MNPAKTKTIRHKVLSLLLSGTLAASMLTGCESSRKTASASEPVERQIFAMTTVMNLNAYGDDADAALDEAQEEITALDALLSTGTKGSEVWTINQNGGGILSDDTSALTEASLRLYEETGGAFDFTIYPIMDLWGFTRLFGEDSQEEGGTPSPDSEPAPVPDAGEETAQTTVESETLTLADSSSENERLISHVPTQEEIDALLPLVDSSAVAYDAESKTLTLPKGAEIDFGGIAKGYTSQKIMEIFRSHGLSGGLADLGGNIQVMGEKPNGSPWRVGIEDPADTSERLGILSLEGDCTVITSGGYERYLVDRDGERYSHIIDPSTGYPADNDLSSVSIVCSDGTLADGFSTSLCVMGEEKAVSFWKAHSDEFQMVLFDTSGQIIVSEGLADSFSSDRFPVTVVRAG